MKLRIVVMLLLILPLVYSCQEGDGDQDYGFAYIYMPQAKASGGLDNFYQVPSGGGEYAYNFKVEDGELKVILGVLCSGKISKEAYSVSVNSSAPSTEELTAVGGVVMPSSIYSLPQTVDVLSDQSGESFYLDIDSEALVSGAYDGQKLVVTVEISNPSNFELAESGTAVLVVVDVNSIKEFL